MKSEKIGPFLIIIVIIEIFISTWETGNLSDRIFCIPVSNCLIADTYFGELLEVNSLQYLIPFFNERYSENISKAFLYNITYSKSSKAHILYIFSNSCLNILPTTPNPLLVSLVYQPESVNWALVKKVTSSTTNLLKEQLLTWELIMAGELLTTFAIITPLVFLDP